ncbi:hypothetical protein B0537_14695 [Desulforamulus ferrireducens]|uniref:Uncharacterized protein n=1 Tax=Desulforamulus ferrireducens TaxID=1833852 RepID=A0A1S6IZM9_9FIRM|nr:hypothetical protein B0537_14695 [Desulforamulus ferrireducens]
MSPLSEGAGAQRLGEFTGFYPRLSPAAALPLPKGRSKKANGQEPKAKCQKPMAYGLWPKAQKPIAEGRRVMADGQYASSPNCTADPYL